MAHHLTVSGRLTDDPDHKEVGSDRQVTNFVVASREGKDSEGNERTTFFPVAVWGGFAETCRDYLKKGQYVTVYGRGYADCWVGKDDATRAQIKVVANSVDFGPKASRKDQVTDGKDVNEEGDADKEAVAVGAGDDDIPF